MSVAPKTATELYQRAILDHNQRPRFYGEMVPSAAVAQGHNPICGDVVNIFVMFDAQGLGKIQFTAQSCALCKASASIMCEWMQTKNQIHMQESIDHFTNMLTNKGEMMAGDAGVLAIVRDFPARAKCVMLPWKTLSGALMKKVSVSTETEEK